MRRRNRVVHGVVGGLLIAGFLVPSGCATHNYRKEESGLILSQGVKSLNEAKATEISSSGEADLKVAEERMFQAKAAFDQERYNEAARLAREGAVMADLARAKAVTEKSKANADRVRQNLETLQKELEQQTPSK